MKKVNLKPQLATITTISMVAVPVCNHIEPEYRIAYA